MIRHLLFDIDNTLYSASNLMEQRISERMFQFIADFLAIPLEEAIRLQRARRGSYGTTLEWLECEYHLTTETLILRQYTLLRISELTA